jgi:ComF family protein
MRGPVTHLIHAFKYGGAKKLAHFLAERSLPAFRDLNPSDPDFLVAVPLHPTRLTERGYNQSGLLAEELSRWTGVMTAPGLLLRGRATSPQVDLPPGRRAANVEGAFVTPFPAAVKGKVITIVDDVATTGATLRACAKSFLDAGASQVTAVVAAIS